LVIVVDRLTPEARSQNMARIRGKDTSPEMAVRKLLHLMGYRYRLHVRRLPGKPDITFPARKKVVFVRGCFWHRHPGCQYAYMPKSRVGFWQRKFEQNVERDSRNIRALAEQGWRALVVWECEATDGQPLRERLASFLGPVRATM
jgi:DNA mismatch endonuclease, patch repair protein